jgi:fatty-acid peroxygenase
VSGGDQSLALVREGYRWAARLRDGCTAVPTRLMGRRAVVVGGPEGVRRFYDKRLRRTGAIPLPVRGVLFGPGAVHGLDDEAHHGRKALFVDLLRGEAVRELGRTLERHWAAAEAGWDRVVLFDEAVTVIGAAVQEWAGIEPDERTALRSRQMMVVVDGFGTPGPAYLRAAADRVRLDRWARALISGVRAGDLTPPAGSALRAVAGSDLPAKVAAVELLNILRPTVAVAWFVAFAAMALEEQPTWRDRIAARDHDALAAFAQEVRRRYPFVPVLAARARCPQEVDGVRLSAGDLVVLDVYGTDHDPKQWPDPDRFDPSRFLPLEPAGGALDSAGPCPREADPDALVPQGGGEVPTGHRCPGEGVTLTVLATAVRRLAALPYALPPQDLTIDLSRMPTRPRSGVVLSVRHHRPTEETHDQGT